MADLTGFSFLGGPKNAAPFPDSFFNGLGVYGPAIAVPQSQASKAGDGLSPVDKRTTAITLVVVVLVGYSLFHLLYRAR